MILHGFLKFCMTLDGFSEVPYGFRRFCTFISLRDGKRWSSICKCIARADEPTTGLNH